MNVALAILTIGATLAAAGMGAAVVAALTKRQQLYFGLIAVVIGLGTVGFAAAFLAGVRVTLTECRPAECDLSTPREVVAKSGEAIDLRVDGFGLVCNFYGSLQAATCYLTDVDATSEELFLQIGEPRDIIGTTDQARVVLKSVSAETFDATGTLLITP